MKKITTTLLCHKSDKIHEHLTYNLQIIKKRIAFKTQKEIENHMKLYSNISSAPVITFKSVISCSHHQTYRKETMTQNLKFIHNKISTQSLFLKCKTCVNYWIFCAHLYLNMPCLSLYSLFVISYKKYKWLQDVEIEWVVQYC